ncbi:hypothetical protein [Paenibacillus sp. YN15]|uniref:hypothetical protein n=1 Tax=Paenibacillus sp. YN15 TaxID=1742774 RepID=UPI000DCB4C77|nr:hypothetical protein [Paenibacillus sp. YN15]RAU95118.1 hypothetical protein DQG13_22925 [Paenibacillus sp. YN15]
MNDDASVYIEEVFRVERRRWKGAEGAYREQGQGLPRSGGKAAAERGAKAACGAKGGQSDLRGAGCRLCPLFAYYPFSSGSRAGA